MPKLGVNVDHVATLRQARREFDPDPIAAARCCERAGADSIVAHLREDRRHIQDKDIRALRKIVATRLNLEMSLDERIIPCHCLLRWSGRGLDRPRKRAGDHPPKAAWNVVKHFRPVKKRQWH